MNANLVGGSQGRPTEFAWSRESTAIETVIRASVAIRRGWHAVTAVAALACSTAGMYALVYGPSPLVLAFPAFLALALVHVMPMMSRDGANVRIRAPGLEVRLSPTEIEVATVRARWGNYFWFRLPDRLGEPPFYLYVDKRDL